MKAGILLILLVTLAAIPAITFGPSRITKAHALLSMPNPEYTLQANFNGWNFSQPSGVNPTIVSVFLFPGQTLTATSYIVDGITHTLAYYQPGTQPSQVGVLDTCASGNPCLATVAVQSSTPVTLQFAFSSADTFELYCQRHPFSMHAKVFVDRSPDTNADHVVNIIDLVAVAIAFGTSSGGTGFNPKADLNRDNSVNIIDLVDVAVNFQRTV